MPPGGVADGDDPMKVEVEAPGGEGREVIQTGGHVLEGPGPTAASPDPAVFQIPDGVTPPDEVVGKGSHLVAGVGHAPEPPMEEADDGRVGRIGQMEIAHLRGMGVVGHVGEQAAARVRHGGKPL
jgi:hypothetical protein